MFVVLNVVGSGKRKLRRGKTVDKIREVSTGGGDKFYIVDVLCSAKGVNWDEVAYFVGRHGKSVLLDKRIELPEFSLLERFDSRSFKSMLLFNTLEVMLKQMYLSGYRTTCYINDRKGDCTEFLGKIVRFSSETVVITDNSYRYFSESEKLYSQMGAGITVTDSATVRDRGAIVIDTDGSFDYKGVGTLFSPCFGGYTPLYADGFNDLKALCPPYIDVLDFLGALSLMNHEKRLADGILRAFTLEEEAAGVTDIVSTLEKSADNPGSKEKSVVFYV